MTRRSSSIRSIHLAFQLIDVICVQGGNSIRPIDSLPVNKLDANETGLEFFFSPLNSTGMSPFSGTWIAYTLSWLISKSLLSSWVRFFFICHSLIPLKTSFNGFCDLVFLDILTVRLRLTNLSFIINEQIDFQCVHIFFLATFFKCAYLFVQVLFSFTFFL